MLEVFTFIVALILLILPIVDWTAVYILRKAFKRSNNNIVLRERGIAATFLAIASTLSASLAVVRLLELHPNGALVLLILSTSLILGSLPNIYWLSLYYRNNLRK